VLSKQHKEALFKRSVIDLITLFTYNIKAALTRGKKVIMFTPNIQKTFNVILKRQLLRHITKQGWPFFLF
jgi:hypothetical protein